MIKVYWNIKRSIIFEHGNKIQIDVFYIFISKRYFITYSMKHKAGYNKRTSWIIRIISNWYNDKNENKKPLYINDSTEMTEKYNLSIISKNLVKQLLSITRNPIKDKALIILNNDANKNS